MADFALGLLKLTPAEECVVMSPLSLVAALSVLLQGAGGRTKSQIVDALKRKSDGEVPELIRQLTAAEGVLMAVATRFYLSNTTSLLNEYNNEISSSFGVTAEKLDFRDQHLTIETVNGFVSEATHGMLRKLLSQDFYEPEMSALLVNAVYFKGMWSDRFSSNSTQKHIFHGIRGDREESFMMKSKMKTCRYSTDEGVEVLALPYKDKEYEFVIFLPFESVSFPEFREQLTGNKMTELLATAREVPSGINVTIPKFKMEKSLDMKEMLVKLGIADLFSDTSCDLSGVSPDPLYVSDVIHKAVIEVNEEGTEAAAATGMVMMARSMLMEIDFVADRPFLYGIFRHGEPIFIGQYC